MSSLPARALAPLLALLVLAPPAHAAPVFERLGATGARVLAVTSGASGTPVRAGEGATLLRVDEDAIAAFRAARGGRLSIPDATGGSVDLELEPLDILAPGASVTYTDGSGRHAFTADVSLYKGHVAGDPASWVVLSMGASGVLGLVERDGRRFTLSPTQRMSTHAPGGLGVHAFAPEGSLAEAASRFECGINADNERQYMPHVTGRDGLDRGLTTTPEAPQLNSPRFTFNVAGDCDFEIYSSKFAGDLNAATSYILTVLGTVNLIYERDLEATLKFPFVNLWTTAADPYSATTTQAELTEFQNYWNANMGGVSRNVAHLISGRPLGGGIAFIDGLCTGPGYGLSAIDCAYTYPTATTTWDVEVIAHELGHNFGSYHTHSCSWAAQGFLPAHTLIDSCQASEGSCATYTNHLPPDKGTIMSYCHLIGGVANGTRLDFHPVCVSRMRSVMSGCGALASLAPPRNPNATPLSNGGHPLLAARGGAGGGAPHRRPERPPAARSESALRRQHPAHPVRHAGARHLLLPRARGSERRFFRNERGDQGHGVLVRHRRARHGGFAAHRRRERGPERRRHPGRGARHDRRRQPGHAARAGGGRRGQRLVRRAGQRRDRQLAGVPGAPRRERGRDSGRHRRRAGRQHAPAPPGPGRRRRGGRHVRPGHAARHPGVRAHRDRDRRLRRGWHPGPGGGGRRHDARDDPRARHGGGAGRHVRGPGHGERRLAGPRARRL